MNDNNRVKCKKSISTYDFSTLYTSIPQSQLKDNIAEFIKRVFTIKDKKYVVIGPTNMHFSNVYKKTNKDIILDMN